MAADRRDAARAIDLEGIRNAVGLEVSSSSLRETARRVGLSPSGLGGFLNGKPPRPETLRKLAVWYAEREWKAGTRIGRTGASAALWILTAHLPEPVAEVTRADVVRQVKRATLRWKLPWPVWLQEMAREAEEARTGGGPPEGA